MLTSIRLAACSLLLRFREPAIRFQEAFEHLGDKLRNAFLLAVGLTPGVAGVELRALGQECLSFTLPRSKQSRYATLVLFKGRPGETHLMPQTDVPTPSRIRAVERAITLLLYLGRSQRSQSLQNIAREVGCSKSTIHRLLDTLEQLEVVEREQGTPQYRPGRRLRELMLSRWTELDLRHLALPQMRELRDKSKETVTLATREGWEFVIIEQCESPEEIRQKMRLWERIPLLNGGATAKAILAFMSAEEVDEIRQQIDGPEQSLLDDEERSKIRMRKYAYSRGERVPDGTALSAPILGDDGHVQGALTISGPRFRLTRIRATELSASLIRAAGQISAKLGYGTREPC